MIGERECLAFWPVRIGTCRRDRVWYRVPYLEVLEDMFHDVGVIDKCDDAQDDLTVEVL